MLDPEVEELIMSQLLHGQVLFVLLGMPCTTFSVARRDDGIGPGPLRSTAYPMGSHG